MSFYGPPRFTQMQEEMERFEKEIAGQLARPPIPRAAGPNMSLRFIPHQLHARPVAYAPQQPPFAHGISTAAVAAAALAATAGAPRFPPAPAIGQRQTSAVIEAAPTKYTATTGNKTDSRQAIAQSIAAINSLEPPPTAPPVVMPKPDVAPKSEPSHSKSNESKSSNSTLAYTVVGGTNKLAPASAGQRKIRRYVRTGGGEKWSDPSLNDWDPNDYRLFCGDLGNEVSDELLAKAFRKYPSFQKAKVVRDKRTNKTKGYGFISFKDPEDFTRAMREMDGKYVGNRPIKLRKSTWKDRNVEVVKKKMKVKQKLGLKL